MNKLIVRIGIFIFIVLLFACTGGDSSPGYEYMPNMYRSPSIETYEDHTIDGYNGMPVEGTIAQGKLSTFLFTGGYKLSDKNILVNYNEEEIGLDGNIIDIEKKEPIKLKSLEGIATYPEGFLEGNKAKTLNDGKELFGMMCSHCHGEGGDGQGTINNVFYSKIPSYKDADTTNIRRSGTTMNELKEGHIFHAITYGINAMGPHASQITEEERWKIVYYIQNKLQH